MKVKIEEVRTKLAQVFENSGAEGDMIDWLVDLAIGHELEGSMFSGFEGGPEGVAVPAEMFEIIETLDVDRPALKLINGNGKSAKIIMKELIPLASKWAKEQGQIFIGFKNCGYHSSLSTIARKFAENDLICIYSANGGPQGVVPYGGTKDICGTNPIAYGIPTFGNPIVFDAATAQYAYGSIKIAREKGLKLPADSYLDEVGNYTTEPTSARSIVAFGGYKGYAINLLLEVMTGALVGGVSGTLQTTENEIGGFLMLIDPSALGDLDDFKGQVDQLIADIESNKPAKGFKEVRVPGYRSQKLRQKQLDTGFVEIDEKVWKKFVKELDK